MEYVGRVRAFLGICVFTLFVTFFASRAAQANTTTGSFFQSQANFNITPFLGAHDLSVGDVNFDGTDDIIAANAFLMLWYPMTIPFFGILSNENATSHAVFSGSPAIFPMQPNGNRRTAIADFNLDGRPDVVTLTWALEVLFSPNEGQTDKVRGFVNHTMPVASLAPSLGLTFPNTNTDPLTYAPIFLAGDFDQDGFQDLVIGIGLMHGLFLGSTSPQTMTSGGLFFLFGNGDGTFAAPQHVQTPEIPIDAEWVDLDNNGYPETFLFMGQKTWAYNQYEGWLNVFDIAQTAPGVRTITPRIWPQMLGTGTYTSLAYLPDRPATATAAATPKIVALGGHYFPTPNQMKPAFFVTEINSGGYLTGTANLIDPTVSASWNMDLQAVQTADFDRDGYLDLVGVVEGQLDGTAVVTQPLSEVTFVAGPFDQWGAHGAMGSLAVSNTYSPSINRSPVVGGGQIYSPNRAKPDMLRVINLDKNQAPDLVWSNVFYLPTGASSNQLGIVMLKNLTPSPGGLPSGSVERISGYGTPNPSGRVMRCGSHGGNPVFGASDFNLSVSGAPSSGVGAVFGSFNLNPHTSLGLNMGITPEFYGYLQAFNASVDGTAILEQNLWMPATPSLIGGMMNAYFQWVAFDNNTSTLECSDVIKVNYGY